MLLRHTWHTQIHKQPKKKYQTHLELINENVLAKRGCLWVLPQQLLVFDQQVVKVKQATFLQVILIGFQKFCGNAAVHSAHITKREGICLCLGRWQISFTHLGALGQTSNTKKCCPHTRTHADTQTLSLSLSRPLDLSTSLDLSLSTSLDLSRPLSRPLQ